MEVRTKLRPGENGTKTLLKQYGEQLVCVRCRYHKARRKRYKTVDLIIDEKDCIPDTLLPAGRRVYFRIRYCETELREQVKLAGGYWNPDKKGLIPGIPESDRTGAGAADNRPGLASMAGRYANRIRKSANAKYSNGD